MTQFDQRYQQVDTQYNADQITIQQQPLSLTEKQWKQNRARMLERVQAVWINGVLEPSMQGAAQIALELENKPSAVLTPLLSVLREFDKTGPLSSADASIVQVYERANGELLILGEPGAGKTTLLLELTHALLERARQDESQPIPVVFPLSSWTTRRQPLTEWLVAGLHSRYQVPFPLATSWIKTDQVLPLLDGLDEVAAPHRAECVEAINAYRQDHGLLPTVVCSRQTDYLALSTRLLLRTAIVVQPLTEEQIASYLASGGERLESLRQALHKDTDLRALASSPLMLNVLTAAYQGTTPQEIVTTGSLGLKRDQVFASYVQRMLTHRSAKSRYTPQQTIHWLSSLADHMKRQNHTIFYIEQMQPNWLSGNRMLRAYDWLGVRLPSMLIGALVGLAVTAFLTTTNLSYSVISILLGGFLGELWSGRYVVQSFVVSEGKTRSVPWLRILQWLGTGVLIGLIVAFAFWLDLHLPLKSLPGPLLRLFWLSLGLSLGLSFGLWNTMLQILIEKSNTAENSPPPLATMWQRLVSLVRSPGVGNGLLTGLLFALISGMVFPLVFGLLLGLALRLLIGLFLGLAVGLLIGLFLGLSSGILSALLMRKGAMVQPVDQLIWSWGSLGRNLFSKRHIQPTVVVGLVIGLASVLIYVLIYVLATSLAFNLVYLYDGLITGLINTLIIGLGYWLLLGFWQGVSSATIEDQRRVVPNQGIRRSAFNSLALGLVSTMIVGLTALLSKWLTSKLTDSLGAGLLAGLLAGLFAGLAVGLLNGGLACLRHYLLRFLLWRVRSMPWNYIQFLDDAVASILLRKVGGGYIFLHRLLLDYFADLETGSGSVASAASR